MKHYNIISIILLIVLYNNYNFSSKDVFASENYIIASFSTLLTDQDANVKRNITRACEKLNGTVISPNGIFSFNGTVGEGSAKNGYALGRVLYRENVAMEPGGGLCQVSSTLFNALVMAGCVIIERHRHFQPVAYVPLGRDATIKFGKKDLRMKNPYSYNLKIQIHTNEKSLFAIIIADQKISYRYEIQTEEEELPVAVTQDSDNIRHGISVQVFRKRYAGQTLIDTALLYKDYYPPVYVR